MDKQHTGTKNICQNCQRYKMTQKANHPFDELGECWLHAPVVGVNADGEPVQKQVHVKANDGCGDFTPKA